MTQHEKITAAVGLGLLLCGTVGFLLHWYVIDWRYWFRRANDLPGPDTDPRAGGLAVLPGVRKIAAGGVTWVIVALTALAPPFIQSMTMWRGDDALAELGMPSRKELAEVARADFQKMITDMQDEMLAAAREAGQELAA